MRLRIWIIGLSLAVVAATHGLTPTDSLPFLGLHVVMRKLFFVPVVVAAVWFGLRGALLSAAAATVLYLPHVVSQWSGQLPENVNQIGEITSIWIVALLAGVLVEREERARRQLLESHRGALMGLVVALDARERETERHSLRVAALAERLGCEMGLSGTELETLKIAALVHDIGKIGVSDEILLGGGPLDPEARAAVERHPEIGYRILRRIPSLRDVAAAVYSHHERFDGAGYPRGLAGREIPLHARIFAVVDAFDAMTSGRPYQSAMEVERARQTIAAGSERQFDPEAVKAFLRVPTETWRQLALHATVQGPSVALVGGATSG